MGRPLIVLGVIAGGLWVLVRVLRDVPKEPGIPFEAWYGNWPAVLVATGLFLLFLWGFTQPRVPGLWPWVRRRAARLEEKVLQQ